MSALAGLAAIDAELVRPVRAPLEIIGYARPDGATSALRPFRPDGRLLKSPLVGVADAPWTDFVFSMKVGDRETVSGSNGLGLFDVRYKRLRDFGLVENVHYERDPVTNRSVQVAYWVPPLTRDLFLKSASAQYKVFVASMSAYFRELRARELALPKGVSASGALAILHRGGPGALAKWGERQFEATRDLCRLCNGVF